VFAVFNETGLEVKQRTGGAQQPWVSSSPIAGQFSFAGAPEQPLRPTRPPSAPTGGNDDAVEIAFWNSVKDAKNPAAVQAYLQQYPQGKFASLATLKLKELSEASKPGPQVAVGSTPQQPQTPPATIVGNDGAEMVLVPAGEFRMGSDTDEIDRLLRGQSLFKRVDI
jgi:formylglycine-generating enzyme required for sulfatase activity